jgi:hypothetical protein
VAPVVANAVYDALGVRVKDLPHTPEKVWRAMRRSDQSLSYSVNQLHRQ